MVSVTPQNAVRAPQQQRSRRTLERILIAAEELLADHSMAEITILDIVRRARTSTGSFYGRFADKESLLPALYDRYDATVKARVDRLTKSPDWPPATLDAAAERITRHFVWFFCERKNLLRALALFVRMHPQKVSAGSRRRRGAAHEPLVAALLAHRREIRHPDPERAVQLGLYFVVCACRDRILFADSTHAATIDVSRERFTNELTRMLLAYLKTGDTDRVVT
jgi:AcrR family transcriptional regulator